MVAAIATISPLGSAYKAALGRAAAEKLVAFPDADRTAWSCKGYTVSVTGPKWFDLTCTCKGRRHVACKHRAAVAFAIRHGLRPIRPAVKGKEVGASPAFTLQPSVLLAGPGALAELYA
jgi:hypothetical protein